MEKCSIGLALSGGGVRAIAFHAGVLRWLSESGTALEDIAYISSVSGGSLFVGLVLALNQLKWPTSKQYSQEILPRVRALLTEKSLQSSAIRNLLLRPTNWRYLLSRANVLAKTIESLWGVRAVMSDLPASPIWSINGTTGESGVRFRIKGSLLGDYTTGYATMPRLKLATAMAMSAAFPVGIGPLSMPTGGLRWHKRKSWDNAQDVEDYVPPYKVLHLYDGGLYDNLGIEPLFDAGRQELKTQETVRIDRLIVSDASPPMYRKEIPSILDLRRLKRLIDITLSQVRALRVRAFVNYIRTQGKGMYLQIGVDAISAIVRLGKPGSPIVESLKGMSWLSGRDADNAAHYPTTLNRMQPADFDLLVRHGYETARWNAAVWEAQLS